MDTNEAIEKLILTANFGAKQLRNVASGIGGWRRDQSGLRKACISAADLIEEKVAEIKKSLDTKVD